MAIKMNYGNYKVKGKWRRNKKRKVGIILILIGIGILFSTTLLKSRGRDVVIIGYYFEGFFFSSIGIPREYIGLAEIIGINQIPLKKELLPLVKKSMLDLIKIIN